MVRLSSDTFLRHSDVAPPPIDHVARALCKLDARDAALALLRAAVRRDAHSERGAEALLRALEARPDAAVAGPELVLNLDLVDMYLARGWFAEANVLIHGAGLATHVEINERVKWVKIMLSVQTDAPQRLIEAENHIASGRARLGLTMLDQWTEQNGPLPTWACEKRDLLVRLLGAPADERDRIASSPTLPLLVRQCGEAIAARDFEKVEKLLSAHLKRHPEDVSAAAFLASFKRVRTPSLAVVQHEEGRTVPFDEVQQAELQIEISEYEQARSLYRDLAAASPHDVARAARASDLDDVVRFLAGGTITPGTVPPPGVPRLSVFAPDDPPNTAEPVVTRRVILVG